MPIMLKTRITALLILLIGFGISFFVYRSEVVHNWQVSNNKPVAGVGKFPFKLGLDLSGGTHLIYNADVSKVDPSEVKDSMNSLRDIIERRVNIFGVSEPSVTVENGSFSNIGQERLIVDLPGVTDVSKAVEMIGQTPILEFKVENPNKDKNQKATLGKDGKLNVTVDDQFVSTQLTGRFLDHAILEFNQTTAEPVVSLQFNPEGSALFEKITGENIGKRIAIYLDGEAISVPVVNEKITGGRAQISGGFRPQDAKILVNRLNSGALPVPISLVSTQTIGPSLGTQAMHAGVRASLIGLLVVALFLILWYRLPGIISVIALTIYVAIMLAIFKLLPVTLTAAGIAGFIISVGLAVDANVLIFERLKEELHSGRSIEEATKSGFSRAWLAIRDSNIAHIITGILLFWFGTSLIKGFALVFMLGVMVSMFSAITVSKMFLYAINAKGESKFIKFLFSSGLSK